jgi:hypothetical protein
MSAQSVDGFPEHIAAAIGLEAADAILLAASPSQISERVRNGRLSLLGLTSIRAFLQRHA